MIFGQLHHLSGRRQLSGKARMTETDPPKRAQGDGAIIAPRTIHSEKPGKLMDEAELVSHPPRLEMFARRQRLGWDAWDNGVAV